MDFTMKFLRKIVIGLVFLLGFMLEAPVGTNRVAADSPDRYLAYVGEAQDSFGAPIYVQNLNTGKIDVAYCINESKKIPYSDVYNRFDATPERLMALDKPLVDRQKLPDIIKRIIYNGYPLNASKLQGTLSDGAFRRVTQLAIWHYSDSYTEAENELTPEEKVVYNQLLQSVNPVPINLNLNIYIRDDNTYQDLLGTSFGELPEHPEFSSSSSTSSSSSSESSRTNSSSSSESFSSSEMSSSSSTSETKAENTSSSSEVSSSSSSTPHSESSSVNSSSSSYSSSSSVTTAESTSSTTTSSSSSSESQESSSSSSTPSSSSSGSEVSSTSSSAFSNSSSSESTPGVSSTVSSSSTSVSSSSVPSMVSSSQGSETSQSERVTPSGSSTVKKATQSKPASSSVRVVDKEKDLPHTGENYHEVLWLSIIGCVILAGSLWMLERKYK